MLLCDFFSIRLELRMLVSAMRDSKQRSRFSQGKASPEGEQIRSTARKDPPTKKLFCLMQ